jgi:HK97 family phage major capsid protein
MTIAELLAARGKAYDALLAHGKKKDFAPADQPEYDRLRDDVIRLDGEITRAKDEQELAAKSAVPVAGQERTTVPAAAETDRYVKDKSLIIGGVSKMIGMGGGNLYGARQACAELYGESHPVTKALNTSTFSAGGVLVASDVMAEIIPLLRARAVVRSAGPRNLPMPHGTMRMPGQSSSATASYGTEGSNAKKSQPKAGAKVASYKKLLALVPVSNDFMRYADAAVDAWVRDDMIKVMGLTEDFNFLLSDGTQDTPRGFTSFANGWVALNKGTVGVWSTTANSIFAVNGADPANSTGGNFITSTANFTLATVAAELGGVVNRLDSANVPEDKRAWFMHPRSYNYLYNVQNSLGVYVYRDELSKGKLMGYPVYKTTQIGTAYWDATGTNKDLSFVILVEMTEDVILDSMQLELAVSKEGTYYDETGALVSVFQRDETLLRAISEHDHQVRHDEAIAVIQGVRWAPSIQ